MITSETPYKEAEIIRDTWPQLFRPFKKNVKEKKCLEDLGESIRGEEWKE